MTKLKLIVLILTVCLTTQSLYSQVSSRSRRVVPAKQSKKTFADQLWYGGGFTLSFASGFAGLSGNTFNVGISHMVAYKLNSIFSVGPRFEMTYSSGRFQQSFGLPVAKYNGIDYGAGVFGRAKLFNWLFAHSELSYINQVFPIGFSTNNKILTERQGNNQLLAGLGYSSGGLFRSEVYLLYDFFNNNTQSTQLPIVYRFGFTYNF